MKKLCCGEVQHSDLAIRAGFSIGGERTEGRNYNINMASSTKKIITFRL